MFMMKQVKADTRGLGQSSERPAEKRQYEIDNESAQLSVVLSDGRDLASLLAERLEPFLRASSPDNEGAADVNPSCPFAAEIQAWRHRAQCVNATMQDILNRLEVDWPPSPKAKAKL
jgi:hypothetical protein